MAKVITKSWVFVVACGELRCISLRAPFLAYAEQQVAPERNAISLKLRTGSPASQLSTANETFSSQNQSNNFTLLSQR